MALLIPFVSSKTGKHVDRLAVEHITPEIVRNFLGRLEQARRCCISTRNQRLAAIHALARLMQWPDGVLAGPNKRAFWDTRLDAYGQRILLFCTLSPVMLPVTGGSITNRANRRL
jgi:hypothetical protein